jgi:hypothetical protein
MGRGAAIWTVTIISLILVIAVWWIFNIYAPAPSAVRISGHQFPQPLSFELPAVLSIRNTNDFAWTDVTVQIWVCCYGGDTNPHFTCLPESSVEPKQVLAVPLRECARPLPVVLRSVSMLSFELKAREGFIYQILEPPFPISHPELQR